MRCVQDKRFGYILNPWSDGRRVFKNESQSGRTWPAMMHAAADSPEIAERVKLFQYRVLEELYDFQADPDALHNLVSDSRYRAELDAMRGRLRQWMVRTQDPALEAFDNRGNPEALAKFMESQAVASQAGNKARAKADKAKGKKNGSPKAGERQ
jgi:N-sulfoglucosamine sulfohydrolase